MAAPLAVLQGGRGASGGFGPGGFGPPRMGEILPSFMQERLSLTAAQKKKVDGPCPTENVDSM